MGGVLRATAVLHITLPGSEGPELLALDVQRKYFFDLTINGKPHSGGNFFAPLGDERWRDVMLDMRSATEGNGQRQTTDNVRSAGRQLYRYLCEMSPDLSAFLRSNSQPRRLVIESQRPEIHQLPWEAMVDEKWRLLADLDVSVAHSSGGFVLAPEALGGKLVVQAIFGPGTERKTAGALDELEKEIAGHRSEKIKITKPVQESRLSGEWFEKLTADIVHIEAHGDPETGETELPDRVVKRTGSADPNELAQRLRSRQMVLLWSCYSAAMHSWGTSVAHSLHRSENVLVLGFSTPLRYESSAALATRFYRAVFTDRRVADPESAIVKERSWLYSSDLNSCEWASMTLWLRHPLDTSLAALEGPRLPQGSKEWSDGDVEKLGRIREIFANNVVPGRTVLISREELYGPLPLGLVKEYDGPVVHLRGRPALEKDSIFEELGIEGTEKQRAHPGDRFLLLLDALGSYSRSLFIWSGIGEREVGLLGLLSKVPDGLAIVLVSAETNIVADPGIVVCEGTKRGKQASKQSGAPEGLEALVKLAEVDRFLEAASLWAKLLPKAHNWNRNDLIRFYSQGYWALVRSGNQADAEFCIRSLTELDKFEALLIAGNFLDRKGLYGKALESYSQAKLLAQNSRDWGRSMVELAYVTYELRDFPLAEALYVKTIAVLEGVEPNFRDSTWGSALGRALRDFADALSRDPSRTEQANALLRRAMAVHAIDGRLNQVAATLQTRAKLASVLGKFEEAEESLQSAAVIFLKVHNRAGWAYTAWWLARLALERGKLEQALAILENSFRQLSGQDGYRLDKGRIALEMARVYLSKGHIVEAKNWSKEALELFPTERRQERKEADSLVRFCGSLLSEQSRPSR